MPERVVAGYLRVSSARQRDESDSIASQRERLKQAGATVFYEDPAVSGFKLDQRRKAQAFQRLLVDISAGRVERLLCTRLDRAARRDSIVLELADHCDAHGVEFMTLASGVVDTGSASGWLGVKMQLVIAEHFSRQLSENIRGGYRGLHDQGIPARSGASLPIHLQRIPGTRHGVEPSPAWDDCRHAVEEFLAGRWRLSDISEHLHQRHGRMGSGKAVSVWLQRQHLLGHLATTKGEVLIRNCWPALVTPLEFEEIQERLRSNARRWGANHRHQSRAMSGLLRCRHCGAVLAYNVARRPCGNYSYIRCSQRGCPTKRAGVRADRLEQALLMQWIGDYLHHIALAHAEAGGLRVPSDRLQQLRQELRAREALPPQFQTTSDAQRIRELRLEIAAEEQEPGSVDPAVLALLDQRLSVVPNSSGWGECFQGQVVGDHWGWFEAPGLDRSEEARNRDLRLLIEQVEVDLIAGSQIDWIRRVRWRIPVFGPDGPMEVGEIRSEG